jgi:hypothetical protein
VVIINISEKAIEQIKKESKKHTWEEFGGYVIVKDNIVDEIIFDIESCNGGHVKLGCKEIIKLPEEKQNNVRGWFHKHPINGPSQMDIHTILDLTNFWGECYTLILQSNEKLLCIKTIKGKDLIFNNTVVISTENEEKKIFPLNFYPRLRNPFQEPDFLDKVEIESVEETDTLIEIIPPFEESTDPQQRQPPKELPKKPALEFIELKPQPPKEKISNNTTTEFSLAEKKPTKPLRELHEQQEEGNFSKKQINNAIDRIIQSKKKQKPKNIKPTEEKPKNKQP